MARPDLLAALKQRPLLCDGAMGTQLIAAGLQPGACGELWNVEKAEVVESIHRRYRSAGCQLITTNTFGATRANLERHGLVPQLAEINKSAVQNARLAAGSQGYVLGDIGPFGGFLEPVGDAAEADVLALFVEQAKALAQADAFIIETMSDPAEMALAIRAVRNVSSLPVIATYAFSKSPTVFRTMMGTPAADAIKTAIDAGADVVGANCGTGLDLPDYVRLARDLMAAAGSTPVILQPNAGAPRHEGGKLVYDALPQQMAAIVPQLCSAGLKIVGGCCGTTPDHLAAMGKALS
ncbi:MAG: homocysteine S-methyltransferase family protein [Tepidisphaeraceae bacterium]